MKFEKFNTEPGQPTVLIAPLDWGLGHATRCIPIIYSLLAAGLNVVIGANGPVKVLLQKEFPALKFVSLKGYSVFYSHSKSWLPVKLALQLPKILIRIYREHQWLKKVIRQYRVDAVISDNRLGLFHRSIPCVYITHQLLIKTGNRFTESLLQKIHYYFINKYATCWVPDSSTPPNLAGELSHPQKLPAVPLQYLGALSRFTNTTAEKRYDCLVLLSGPEPQRTIFENLLLKELEQFNGRALLVRGLPGTANLPHNENSRLEIKNHLGAAELNIALAQAAIVVCRSGYTSIMDLVSLQQRAILVPTPGQTEQEYLAAYLQQQQVFLSFDQQHFSLGKAIGSSHHFPFVRFPLQPGMYNSIIQAFAQKLKQHQ